MTFVIFSQEESRCQNVEQWSHEVLFAKKIFYKFLKKDK